MHPRPLAFLLLLLTGTIAPAQVDTAAVVAAIKQRIALANDGQIGAVFIRMPDQELAQRIDPESPGPEEKAEKYDLYCDESGNVLGIGTFVTPTLPGVEEWSTHYFDDQGRTVAVQWQLRWPDSRCAQDRAWEVRTVYYHPADTVFMDLTTLTDERGNLLKASACKYPRLERAFDAYPGRDAFLRAKGIRLEP